MLTVEILCHQGTIVLRARNSELLILPQYVKELKGLKEPQAFSQYFMREALVNRPARKLFEAWLRKDRTVWPRLFKTVEGAEIPTEEQLESLVNGSAEPSLSASSVSLKNSEVNELSTASSPVEPKSSEEEVKKAESKKKTTKIAKKTAKKSTNADSPSAAKTVKKSTSGQKQSKAEGVKQTTRKTRKKV